MKTLIFDDGTALFEDFGLLASNKNELKKLSKRVEKSLKNHSTLVQKSIRKAFNKNDGFGDRFLIDFWIILGAKILPKLEENQSKIDTKTIMKKVLKKEVASSSGNVNTKWGPQP